jgi:hypothetical protein
MAAAARRREAIDAGDAYTLLVPTAVDLGARAGVRAGHNLQSAINPLCIDRDDRLSG